MRKVTIKALLFFGGTLLAGISLFNFDKQPYLAFAGLMVGAYLIIKGLD